VPEISNIPLGTLPQWLLLIVIGIGFAKWLFPWRADEMRLLRAELKKCEEDCDLKIKRLEEDLWGEKRQRVSEQISFLNAIINSIDAPELKTMLKSLESVQSQFRVQRIIENGGGK
jgi:hypothetical protein